MVKNGLNCPDKLKNASECNKLNIDFKIFSGVLPPNPRFWREGERTWEGEDPTKFPRQVNAYVCHIKVSFFVDFTFLAHVCPT